MRFYLPCLLYLLWVHVLLYWRSLRLSDVSANDLCTAHARLTSKEETTDGELASS